MREGNRDGLRAAGISRHGCRPVRRRGKGKSVSARVDSSAQEKRDDESDAEETAEVRFVHRGQIVAPRRSGFPIASRRGRKIAEPAPRVKREFARNPAERAAACRAGRIGMAGREHPASCDVRRPTFDDRDVGGRTSNVEVGTRPSRAPRYSRFFAQCFFIASRRSVVSPSWMLRSLPVSASRMDSRFQP